MVDVREHHLDGRALERAYAGDQLEHHHARRIEVRRRTHGAAANLLRCHELGCAEDGALGGEGALTRLQQLGDAEVDQFDGGRNPR